VLLRATLIALTLLAFKIQASVGQEFEALGESAILEQEIRQVKKTQTLLVSRIDYPAINDPKTTLEHALEKLGEESSLTFEIDIKTLEKEGFEDIQKALIAARDPLPFSENARAYTVLQQILSRCNGGPNLSYVAKRDIILITTEKEAKRQALTLTFAIARYKFMKWIDQAIIPGSRSR
jgi:hypothetical protein